MTGRPPAPLPAFVINLARDHERRGHMAALLDGLGLRAEFVPAVEGARLTAADRAMVDQRRTLQVYGVPLLDNEIGCYLSHYRLYQRMLAEGIEVALIMEDDLDIAPNLPALLEEVLADPAPPWLVLRLESMRPRVIAPRGRRDRGTLVRRLAQGELYRLDIHVLGLGAYLIRREGAARMVEYGARIFMPIDQTMDRFWENGIEPYVVRPFPVRQRPDLASRIGARPSGRRFDAGTAMALRRRWQRIRDSVAKRWHLLRR